MGCEVLLSTGGVPVDISDDGGFDSRVGAAGICKGAGDGYFGHFWVVWIVFGWLDEGCHTNTYHINFLGHMILLRNTRSCSFIH